MWLSNWRRLRLHKIVLGLLVFAAVYQINYYIAVLCRTETSQKSRCLQAPRVQLEQNGDYWIYHGFMRATNAGLHSNMTITLTTHGTYRDFWQLRWLLVRWSAPISMAVYVQQQDMAETLRHLQYFRYCTALAYSWTNFVSMQLIFPDKQMPRMFHRSWWKNFERIRCNQFERELPHFPDKASYPINLLRNVARLNAATFYVLSLDPGLLPTQRFISKFLSFTHGFHPEKPFRSVYCLPVFPQIGEDFQVPIYKSQLLKQMLPFLSGNDSLSRQDQTQLHIWQSWLTQPMQDWNMAIYDITKMPHSCVAYVSSNAYQPFYDQRYSDSIYDPNSSMLQLMAGLGFDFIILDGSYIIRRKPGTYVDYAARAIKQPKPTGKLKHIRQLIKMKAFPQFN